MKKYPFVFYAVLVFSLALSVTAWARPHDGEDGHHAEPGNENGHACRLGENFQHYDHRNNYGPDKNVWCDGTNPELRRHHTGSTVNANLPRNVDFKGGFCIRADVVNSDTLTVQHKNLMTHDKVWLLSGDAVYYPITKPLGEATIRVQDNSWSDRNPAVGKVESEILFSGAAAPGGGGQTSGDGGGCSSFGLAGLVMLGALAIPLLAVGSFMQNI